MRIRSPLLLALLLPLTGCLIDRSTTNEPLAADVVAALEPGRTTAREAVERLGAPVEVVQLGRRGRIGNGSTLRHDRTCGFGEEEGWLPVRIASHFPSMGRVVAPHAIHSPHGEIGVPAENRYDWPLVWRKHESSLVVGCRHARL